MEAHCSFQVGFIILDDIDKVMPLPKLEITLMGSGVGASTVVVADFFSPRFAP